MLQESADADTKYRSERKSVANASDYPIVCGLYALHGLTGVENSPDPRLDSNRELVLNFLDSGCFF